MDNKSYHIRQYYGIKNTTGLPHYNTIFGVHRKRLCYKLDRIIMRLFTLEQ